MADSSKKLVGSIIIEVYSSSGDDRISDINISSSFEDKDTVDIINAANILFKDENLRRSAKV